ncbi:putative reverse transcriptase domain-containing protein, partial [Tanacetum coccineum]
MEINDEMDDPEFINPYEIEEGELLPPPVKLDTSFDTEPKVEVEVEDKTEVATVGTITRVPYHVHQFSGTTYVGSRSSRKVFAPSPMGKDVDTLHHKVKGLAQQMFEQANTEYSTLKRLSKMDRYLGELDTDLRIETRERYELKQSMSTLEDQMRGLMLEDIWIHEHFGVEIPPSVDEERPIEANGDLYHCMNTHKFFFVFDIIMPPKGMSAAAISKLVADKVAKALEADYAARNYPNVAGGSGGNGGQGGTPPVRECSFAGFKKCGPTQFHGNEGAIELCRLFEKTKSVFGISECAERSKVKIFAATLQGRALTWWNSQVATLGFDVANGKSWTDMRKMMMDELCPDEEVQRLENELRSLRLRDINIAAYSQRFNELALLCPEAVPTKKKKVELYIKDKAERVAENNKRKWESNNNQSGNNNNRNNYKDNTRHYQHNNRRQGNASAMITALAEQGGYAGNKPFCNGCKKHHTSYCTMVCNSCGRTGNMARDCKRKAVAIGANVQPIMTEAEKGQGPNVVPGTFLINNRYASVLFDSGSDKSFVNTSLSHLIDIKP